jgi:DNA-directed RNA polymerase beta' subunit
MKIKKISSSVYFDPDNLVTNPEIFSRKTEQVEGEDRTEEFKKFADDGLFSKRIFGDLNSNSEYSCQCGKYVGKVFENITCNDCNAKVELQESNIDKIGWIDLKNHHVIKYINYMLLEKVIGRDNLRRIIHVPNTITTAGDLDKTEIDKERALAPGNKYWYIGIQEFHDNYRTILDYYHELSDKKEAKIYEFLEDSDEVFTNKIPVISTVLRPAMRTEEGLKMDKINNIYINLIKNVQILNDKVDLIPIIRDATIEAIQAEYFQLSQEIMDNIKSKGGLIRNQIMGTRVNFSARNIIGPAKAGYKIDEIVIPYLTFMYLYKLEIMNVVSKVKNINLVAAEKVWFNATLKIDEEMYMVMKKMISEEEIGVLLNRNPTISYGSILYLRVTGVKHDYDDMTMSIHNGILSLLAGDYDGDVLNLISIKDFETREIFKDVFSPISLLIDSNSGDFNLALNLERDQVLGLNNLLL